MARKPRGRKVRVDFRQNRQVRRRSDDWTRQFQDEDPAVEDTHLSESVRPKGDLSRRRTVIMGEDELPLVDEHLWRAGTVTSVHGLICYVDDEGGRVWECTVRRVLRTLEIERRSPVAVGDRVWFSDQSGSAGGEPVGVIERVQPRTTRLDRRDRRGRAHTIVANADQLLITASIAEPQLKPHLIDRYIVAALRGNLTPIVCVNKMDLAETAGGVDPDDLLIYTQSVGRPSETDPDDEPDRQSITVGSVLGEYRALGYRCICTSTVTGSGVDELREALRGHVTGVAGQSGVGKSSLLNAVQPGLKLKVADVSRDTEKGRHTTTLARLLRLEVGGYVVDTPGIRSFDLWSIQPAEFEALFTEFIPHVPRCQFKDCLHRNERGCAIREAVIQGAISRRRYLSYLKMLTEARRSPGERG
ncbi:MAG: ribosome small subunit-dependent GTPase A [Phycisphaerae bacterium]|jgi:ribosome biogenesis GTPase